MPRPVSYTHLDVYKRQVQYRAVTVLAPAKLNLSLDVVGTLPNGYHDLDMVMQTIDPVSYTQLEVYKRQGKSPVAGVST